MSSAVVVAVAILCAVGGTVARAVDECECKLPGPLRREIQSYQGFVNHVIAVATRGPYSGAYYNDLALFVDRFGNRPSGTPKLEESINYVAQKAASEGIQVALEPVSVPHWVRGCETARMLRPREQEMKILGLGTSPGTGPNGITADVMVVNDFDELDQRADEVRGKIVLFNAKFTSYGKTVKYRNSGPARASQLGAVGALVRSVTPFSIYSPHTGNTNFGDNVRPIPSACVTLEDADTMARLLEKGHKVTVYLYMEAKTEPSEVSRNILFDLPGGTLPSHYVTVSGHIDSWDVGQGALDDGVGAFLGLHTVKLLQYMNVPRPRRTIRAIMWTAEEEGLVGAKAYARDHADELQNWTAAIESDFGSYIPYGLNYEGGDEALCIMKEIVALFHQMNATEVAKITGVGSDVSVFKPYGVPLLEPRYVDVNYMWFHHTDGDSMTTLDSDVMDKNLALVAGTSYILANLSVQLPRGNQTVWDLINYVK